MTRCAEGVGERMKFLSSCNLVVEKPVTLEETKKSLRSIQLIFNYFSIRLGQISARDPDRLEVGRGGIEGVRKENVRGGGTKGETAHVVEWENNRV